MSALAINTQYVDILPINNQSFSQKGFEGSFAINSALDQLLIKENDEIIIASPFQKDLIFISEGIIAKVNSINPIPPTQELITKRKLDGLPPPKETFSHNFKIKITKELETNNLLSDLEYSIKSVYRFNNPIVHFQQQFRSLSKQDYDTIVHGWVYAARTTFGKLINAIPRQNKLEFMLQAMDHFSTVDFRDIALDEGVVFLYNYIDRRILSRGRLLVATNKLIKDHLSDIIPSEEIGFFNPKTKQTNNLNLQASAFEDLFQLENKSNIIKFIKKSISEDSQLEQRFLQIFKNETWPIDLSI